jgi:hypothetical protein
MSFRIPRLWYGLLGTDNIYLGATFTFHPQGLAMWAESGKATCRPALPPSFIASFFPLYKTALLPSAPTHHGSNASFPTISQHSVSPHSAAHFSNPEDGSSSFDTVGPTTKLHCVTSQKCEQIQTLKLTNEEMTAGTWREASYGQTVMV